MVANASPVLTAMLPRQCQTDEVMASKHYLVLDFQYARDNKSSFVVKELAMRDDQNYMQHWIFRTNEDNICGLSKSVGTSENVDDIVYVIASNYDVLFVRGCRPMKYLQHLILPSRPNVIIVNIDVFPDLVDFEQNRHFSRCLLHYKDTLLVPCAASNVRCFLDFIRKTEVYKMNLKARTRTFLAQWNSPIDMVKMAQSGFYFTGLIDMVRCISCNIGLSHWEMGEIPDLEHYHWSPSCKYFTIYEERKKNALEEGQRRRRGAEEYEVQSIDEVD